MALNIKNVEIERLAEEVAGLARESKTEAIRRALLERKQRLELCGAPAARSARVHQLLERQIWPAIPPSVLGSTLSKQAEEAILGYGPEGV